jgi:hypothetical protein
MMMPQAQQIGYQKKRPSLTMDGYRFFYCHVEHFLLFFFANNIFGSLPPKQLPVKADLACMPDCTDYGPAQLKLVTHCIPPVKIIGLAHISMNSEKNGMVSMGV